MNELIDGPTTEESLRPGFFSVLCAPVLGIFRIAQAAALLCRASALQLGLILLVYMAIEAAIVVTMCLWENTLRYDYQFSSTHSTSGSWQVESRTMAEVWSQWESHRRGNPAFEISMGAGFATLAAVIVSIALFWPRIHRQGPLRPSLRRTQAAVTGTFGLAVLLTAVVFTVYVLIRHWRMRNGLRWGNGPEEGQFAVIGVLLSIHLMLRALSRSVRAAYDANFAPDPPPQCEGCGYDLSHRPESGLCPECGASMDKSLEPGLGRRPSDFDRDPSLPDAVSTSIEALFSPAAFYRRITVRIEPQRDALFRFRHHLAIFFGAMIWVLMLIYVSTHRGWGWDESTASLAASLAAPLVAWLIQHAVGAIVCLVWVVKRTLPDLRWGVRVVNFETVYLWLFCLFNGTMITSFILFDDWIGEVLGTLHRPTGMPHAVLAMLLPNAGLIGYWFFRMLRSGRAVQWANF